MVLGCCWRISYCGEDDGVRPALEGFAAGEGKQAAAELNGGGLFDQAMTERADTRGHRERISEGTIFEPCLGGGLGDGEVRVDESPP